MPIKPQISPAWLDNIVKLPRQPVSGNWSGSNFSAEVIIPDYRQQVQAYYSDVIRGDLQGFCNQHQLVAPPTHFGLQITFEQATELSLHSKELVLDAGLRQIIERLGAVVVKNAYLDADIREPSHRNRFPHLNFHLDRTAHQVTVYSMYTRDPFDAEQKMPRTSSTLFLPNSVAYLQGVKEGLINPTVDPGLGTSYVLFSNEVAADQFGKLIIEHRWDLPQGVGELSMLDNRTLFHSSYYRDASVKGYKIGVRYLSE